MTLQEEQQKPELIAGRVSAIAEEYFRDWVQSHNRLIHSKRTFLDRIKERSGKNRLVPITDRAMEALDAVPPLPGCPYVLYDQETGTYRKTLRSQWQRARKRARYSWIIPKHLRPAFATDLSERGLESHMIQDLLGHSSVSVTERF